MTRPCRQIRAFTLVELIFAIAVAMVITAVLGKLLLDGIYLQRIAWERANRVAIAGALTDRLRADAAGAVSHTWEEDAAGATLSLLTCSDGTRRQVQWVFRPDDVLRRVDGREAGRFSVERLRFSAQLEQYERADLLVLDLIVSPPARARKMPPRTTSECVLLRRHPGAGEPGERRPRGDDATMELVP